MSVETKVPDLYELAFMPGQFRCPQCDFQWSIQTINVALGQIGTTEENRQTPDCPNDGTRMVNVTYREQLEAYADRLKEELDNVARLNALLTQNGGSMAEMAPQKPSIGRIVIYNHPGSADGKYPPVQSPAIIQNVAADGTVRLFVFGPKGQHMDEGLKQGDGPCQWNWPPRV